MMEFSFQCKKKILARFEWKTIYALTIYTIYGYEDELVFPIYVSHQKFEDSMDMLLWIDDDKSHYVYIKDFDRFIFHKTKKWFCKSLQCFSSGNVLIKHKEDCFSINGKQSIKREKGTIEFKNYSKQIPVPLKIYADF